MNLRLLALVSMFLVPITLLLVTITLLLVVSLTSPSVVSLTSLVSTFLVPMILLLYLDDNTFISSLVDVTFVDVAHNKKTAIGIVNVNCIAFDPVPIVGVAAKVLTTSLV